MSLETLIPLVLRTSIMLTVFSLGLQATLDDALMLFRRPGKLLRSLLAVNVIMPILALLLAKGLHLHPAVQLALIALSVSPVPPLLPKKQLKAGGGESYVIGLLFALSLLSVVLIPVSIAIMGRVFGSDVSVPAGAIFKIVSTSLLAPLLVGLLVRRLARGFAERVAGPLSKIAMIVLLLGVLPILVKAWPAVQSLIGDGTLMATTLFVVAGVLVGHLLGGPAPEDRVVLALATASRHPAIALTIAKSTFPEEKLVAAAIVWFLLVSAIVTAIYMKLQKRRQ